MKIDVNKSRYGLQLWVSFYVSPTDMQTALSFRDTIKTAVVLCRYYVHPPANYNFQKVSA